MGEQFRSDSQGHWPSRMLHDWIPSPINRLIWTLMAVLAAVFSIAGSVVRGLVGAEFAGKAPGVAVAYGVTFAVASLIIGLAIGGWLLRRWSHAAMTTRRQITVLIVTIGAVAVSHVLLISLLNPHRNSLPPLVAIAQFALAVPVAIIVTAVVLYVVRREQDIEESYKRLLAANVALVREEEDVRSRIFDELHGSAQARIVEARMRAQLIAERSTDGALIEEARQLDEGLLDLYQSQIGRMARALYPSGLEVSLRAAVDQLGERYLGVIDIECTYDMLFSILDDPMNAGLYRDLRVALYRVIEECVTNAIRHGESNEISLDVGAQVTDHTPVIVLTATNECERVPALRWGHGLSRMRQRIEVLGGEVAIDIRAKRYSTRVVVPTSMPQFLSRI